MGRSDAEETTAFAAGLGVLDRPQPIALAAILLVDDARAGIADSLVKCIVFRRDAKQFFDLPAGQLVRLRPDAPQK